MHRLGWLVFGVLAFLAMSATAAVRDEQELRRLASEITDVHVIFSNHLDVGFDGIDPTLGFARNVVNRYCTNLLPPRFCFLTTERIPLSVLIHQ